MEEQGIMPTPEEVLAAQAIIDAAANTEEKITFDEKQQAKVTALIKAGKTEAAKELRAERDALKAEHDRAVAELAQLKADAAKVKPAKGEAKGDLEALQAQIEEMKSAQAALLREKETLATAAQNKAKEASDARTLVTNFQRDQAISNAASTIDFYNVSQVAELTSKFVKLNDEGQYIVIGDGGAVRMNAALEPMSLEEFFLDYANKNKHLVKGEVKAGVGSSQRTGTSTKVDLAKYFGAKSETKLVTELGKNPAEYRRLRSLAVAQGLID